MSWLENLEHELEYWYYVVLSFDHGCVTYLWPNLFGTFSSRQWATESCHCCSHASSWLGAAMSMFWGYIRHISWHMKPGLQMLYMNCCMRCNRDNSLLALPILLFGLWTPCILAESFLLLTKNPKLFWCFWNLIILCETQLFTCTSKRSTASLCLCSHCTVFLSFEISSCRIVPLLVIIIGLLILILQRLSLYKKSDEYGYHKLSFESDPE